MLLSKSIRALLLGTFLACTALTSFSCCENNVEQTLVAYYPAQPSHPNPEPPKYDPNECNTCMFALGWPDPPFIRPWCDKSHEAIGEALGACAKASAESHPECAYLIAEPWGYTPPDEDTFHACEELMKQVCHDEYYSCFEIF